MQQFKHVGIYLDEWPDDKDVLNFTARIAELGGCEQIACVCYARHPQDSPDAVRA